MPKGIQNAAPSIKVISRTSKLMLELVVIASSSAFADHSTRYGALDVTLKLPESGKEDEWHILLWSVSGRRLSGGIATGRGVCRMHIEVWI